MGNVTRDIELRYTPKGTAVADIGLAVNRVRTSDGGERIEETTFVDVTLWGRTAEVAHQYSGKGKPLFVEGRLHMDSWDDKATGQKRSKLKVVADNIQLMGAPGWWQWWRRTTRVKRRQSSPSATRWFSCSRWSPSG